MWRAVGVAVLTGCCLSACGPEPDPDAAQAQAVIVTPAPDAAFFEQFKALCIDTKADPGAVRNAALALGWREDKDLTDIDDLKVYAGWDVILQTAALDLAATAETPAAVVRQCQLRSSGARLGWARSLHAWLGLVPSKVVDADGIRYHLRLGSGRPERLDSDDLVDIGAAIRAREYGFVSAAQDGYAWLLFHTAAPVSLDSRGRVIPYGDPPRWDPTPAASPDYLPGTAAIRGKRT